MIRFSYKKFLLIACALFVLLTLPPLFVEKLRGKMIAWSAPLWKGMAFFKQRQRGVAQIAKLEAENHLLRIEIEKLKSLVANAALLEEWQGKIIPAKVIYRDPASFGSSLWIDVGQENNKKLGATIIEKNSPVLLGKSVVGVVEYVGKKESRVRLVTDSALKPSVRALRLQNSLSQKEEGCYLAKGIVHGSGAPLWRVKGSGLVGTGFNYDFEKDKKIPNLSIIEVGDLLVTTGMDGVFPQGLKVGVVSKVYPLREGAYTYDIEAKPTAGNMHELTTVFVIARSVHENSQSK